MLTDVFAISFLQALTEEEQKLFRLYGKLPTHKGVLMKAQRVRLHAYTGYPVHVDEPRYAGPEIFRFRRLCAI